jgi:hypothetical protein
MCPVDVGCVSSSLVVFYQTRYPFYALRLRHQNHPRLHYAYSVTLSLTLHDGQIDFSIRPIHVRRWSVNLAFPLIPPIRIQKKDSLIMCVIYFCHYYFLGMTRLYFGIPTVSRIGSSGDCGLERQKPTIRFGLIFTSYHPGRIGVYAIKHVSRVHAARILRHFPV